MQKENSVVLTGTFKVEQVTPTFSKQVITFASKDRDGQWREGDFETYIKPDLVASSGIQPGDTVKVKGFLVFNFFNKQDGTTMSFPKLIVSEVLEREQAGQAAGQQPAAAPVQPTQPTTMAPGVPPVPGAAPTAPAPQQAAQAFGAPPVPPAPVA